MLSNDDNDSKNAKIKGCNQKWRDFFDNDSIGQRIMACIARENPAWTEDQAVEEMSRNCRHMYYGNPDTYDKMFNRNVIIYPTVRQLQEKANFLSVMTCIATVADSLKENEIPTIPIYIRRIEY